MKITVMVHDDDCGEILESSGACRKCGFHPDMQSVAFKEVSAEELRGRTALGPGRRPVSSAGVA